MLFLDHRTDHPTPTLPSLASRARDPLGFPPTSPTSLRSLSVFLLISPAFLGLFCFCGAWRSMLAFLSLTLVLIRGHLTRLLSNASICYDVISPASTTGTRKDYTNSLIIYRVKLVDADMRWAVAGADMMKRMKMQKWYLDSPLYVSSKTVIE